MSVSYRPLTATMVAIAALLPMACGDASGPRGVSIAVSITTIGAAGDLDPNGYTLIVNGGPTPRLVGINSVETIVDLAAGTHTIRLDGLASNCTVNGPNSRTVDLADGENALLSFSVICSVRVGTIRLTTTTTGAEIDSDGYTISIPGYGGGTITSNESRDFTNVPSGTRTVALLGVAGNCVVSGANPRTVGITPGSTIDVAFVVQCVTGAVLNLTTTTTGVTPDLDGYYVRLIPTGGGSVPVGPVGANGTTVIPRLLPGTYRMEVLQISANCDATTPNPRTVVLTSGSPNQITIDVRCETPRQFAFADGFGATANIYIGASAGGTVTPITSPPGPNLQPAWSPNGSRIAFSSLRDGNQEIYSINADGTGTARLTNNITADSYPSWSPDGTRIAFQSARDGNSEIYVMNADGTNPVRLTNDAAFDSDPAWSPDGTKIAFHSDRGGAKGIWVMRADGTQPARLTSSSRGDFQPAWSPDGTQIAFSRVWSIGIDIYYMNADGSGVTAVTEGQEGAWDPAWSPDGRKIAFTSSSYYNPPSVLIYSINGVEYALPTTLRASHDPAWRP